jgi:hypothetical protein
LYDLNPRGLTKSRFLVSARAEFKAAVLYIAPPEHGDHIAGAPVRRKKRQFLKVLGFQSFTIREQLPFSAQAVSKTVDFGSFAEVESCDHADVVSFSGVECL